MLEALGLSYSYNADRPDAIPALHALDLRIAPGELVAVIGHNGSGKSTLARLFCALLTPTRGSVRVDGITAEGAQIWEVRRRVGMVFQRPDDQLIANSVSDDVAFGPENLGLPRTEITKRVADALAAVGLTERASAQISDLSGGEKQRTAIAGVLAMQPEYLILDEPTTMLAPPLARQLLNVLRDLRDRHGVAVVHITHFIHEVTGFDRVIVMDGGRVLLDGSPRAVFAEAETLRAAGLVVPMVTDLANQLRRQGVPVPPVVLTADELVTALGPLPRAETHLQRGTPRPPEPPRAEPPLLETRDLHYSYLAGTPLARTALRGVNVQIYPGETLAILGGAQAGKSTLIEFFNGLRLAPGDHVRFKGQDVSAAGFDRAALRRAVGIVFQQPETQLFAETVGKDVSYAPRQRKLPPAESRALVAQALTDVGLDYETFRLRYVHALSGGQQRRVALAGVLAAQPQLLVLDEPVAGLDPRGRAELASLLCALTSRAGLTVVLLSSAIDELTDLADRVVVLGAGQVALEGTLPMVLDAADQLHALGLDLSEAATIALALKPLMPDLPTDLRNEATLAEAVLARLVPHNHNGKHTVSAIGGSHGA